VTEIKDQHLHSVYHLRNKQKELIFMKWASR
jgi:hypothetical protein